MKLEPHPIHGKPIGIEAKHITYTRHRYGGNHDLLTIKEKIHYEDGTRLPNLRFKLDFERPFYITKQQYRNYEQKKESIELSKVDQYRSTDIEMPAKIAKALGDFGRGPNPPLKYLGKSPYLFGTDVTSGEILKQKYMDRWPDLISPNTIAAFDIETDVHVDHQPIIMASITFKKNAVLLVDKEWLGEVASPEERFKKIVDTKLGHYIKERQIQLEWIEISGGQANIIQKVAEILHEWQPDFVSVWNLEFEMTKMIEGLEEAGIDPADVFSDPRVPPAYRYFQWKLGTPYMITASGNKKTKETSERWDWCTHPASFQFIDAMTVYRLLRTAKGKLVGGYSLDATLNREMDLTKLHFEETDKYGPPSLRWHRVMQKGYKVEYAVYNTFDSLSLELLDEKTTDLSSRVSFMAGSMSYEKLNSDPKTLVNKLHFWYLKQPVPRVLGSTPQVEEGEDDDPRNPNYWVIDRRGWIITLPSHLMAADGERVIKEAPDQPTLVKIHNDDLDLESTYPTASNLGNISPDTTVFEFSCIEGTDTDRRKALGVNLTGGNVNAIPIVQEYMRGVPLDTMLAAFKEDTKG